ncbi:hypothetical protein Gotri_021859 [Gossypium trilobum]|uniref:Knottins-like domain-containing protein n=1 Tax=Gossypium trilobum TaxID=34281 RepID=A0A7J9DDU9_9ROSI|nr:hypothetical protein [Gossypium trilobum]
MGPVVADGDKICESPSNAFKGLCLRDDNCDIVCKTEGFPNGDCKDACLLLFLQAARFRFTACIESFEVKVDLVSALAERSLKQNFEVVLTNTTEPEVIYAARAFIMQLIGGLLMLNKSSCGVMPRIFRYKAFRMN